MLPSPHASISPARTVAFVLVGVACAVPWPIGAMSAIALAAGVTLATLGCTPWSAQTKALSRWLIQGCIVLLGLRIDLGTLARSAGTGLVLAVATILAALSLGWVLARLLRVERDVAALTTAGTAICGGSAIASVGSAVRASASHIAIATAAVFALNALAVLAFPPLGRALDLSPQQFGLWAGVAVHDMASVGAVARDFDPTSLDVANVTKLARVLWILPLTLAAAWWWGRRGWLPDAGKAPRLQIPWFIALFVLASLLRTLVPTLGELGPAIKAVAGVGFQLALFLIGAAVSIQALRELGWRALVHAALLWLLLSAGTLVALRWMAPA